MGDSWHFACFFDAKLIAKTNTRPVGGKSWFDGGLVRPNEDAAVTLQEKMALLLSCLNFTLLQRLKEHGSECLVAPRIRSIFGGRQPSAQSNFSLPLPVG